MTFLFALCSGSLFVAASAFGGPFAHQQDGSGPTPGAPAPSFFPSSPFGAPEACGGAAGGVGPAYSQALPMFLPMSGPGGEQLGPLDPGFNFMFTMAMAAAGNNPAILTGSHGGVIPTPFGNGSTVSVPQHSAIAHHVSPFFQLPGYDTLGVFHPAGSVAGAGPPEDCTTGSTGGGAVGGGTPAGGADRDGVGRSCEEGEMIRTSHLDARDRQEFEVRSSHLDSKEINAAPPPASKMPRTAHKQKNHDLPFPGRHDDAKKFARPLFGEDSSAAAAAQRRERDAASSAATDLVFRPPAYDGRSESADKLTDRLTARRASRAGAPTDPRLRADPREARRSRQRSPPRRVNPRFAAAGPIEAPIVGRRDESELCVQQAERPARGLTPWPEAESTIDSVALRDNIRILRNTIHRTVAAHFAEEEEGDLPTAPSHYGNGKKQVEF